MYIFGEFLTLAVKCGNLGNAGEINPDNSPVAYRTVYVGFLCHQINRNGCFHRFVKTLLPSQGPEAECMETANLT